MTVFTLTTSCKGQEDKEYSDIQEALKNIEQASVLKIMNNSKYSSFPEEIYKLQKLSKLSFTGSECDTRNPNCKNITQIPKGLERLSNLNELNLVMNNIKTITDEINALKNLKSLDLSNNPSINIDNLSNPNLEILNLNGCNLQKLPKGLIKMKNLKKLGLENNYIDESLILQMKEELPNCEIYW
jgi:Leucine-rich repeat (LRR) protein